MTHTPTNFDGMELVVGGGVVVVVAGAGALLVVLVAAEVVTGAGALLVVWAAEAVVVLAVELVADLGVVELVLTAPVARDPVPVVVQTVGVTVTGTVWADDESGVTPVTVGLVVMTGVSGLLSGMEPPWSLQPVEVIIRPSQSKANTPVSFLIVHALPSANLL